MSIQIYSNKQPKPVARSIDDSVGFVHCHRPKGVIYRALSYLRGAPLCPKLRLSGLKSNTFTTQSPLKSVRLSYVGFPHEEPKDTFSMLKSLTLTQLSLLASPVRIMPISTLVTGPPTSTTPEPAR